MRSAITPGHTSDYPGFDPVKSDNLPEPAVLLLDRGHDLENVRKTIEAGTAVPVVSMRKTRTWCFAVDRKISALRNLVERCFNKLENARHLANRCGKTIESFLGFVDITPSDLWLRHVST